MGLCYGKVASVFRALFGNRLRPRPLLFGPEKGIGEAVDYILRAREEVRELLTPREADRLLRMAISAAEASPDWGPGREHYHEIDEEAYVEEGFERSGFLVRHAGGCYEIDFYHGPGSQFVQ